MTKISNYFNLGCFLMFFSSLLPASLSSKSIQSINEATSINDIYGPRFYVEGKGIEFQSDNCPSIDVTLAKAELRVYYSLLNVDLIMEPGTEMIGTTYRIHPETGKLEMETLAALNETGILLGHFQFIMKDTFPDIKKLGDLNGKSLHLNYTLTTHLNTKQRPKSYHWCARLNVIVPEAHTSTPLYTKDSIKSFTATKHFKTSIFLLTSFKNQPDIPIGTAIGYNFDGENVAKTFDTPIRLQKDISSHILSHIPKARAPPCAGQKK